MVVDDVSLEGVGAVLLTKRLKPLLMKVKNFFVTYCKYTTTERMLLRVVDALSPVPLIGRARLLHCPP